MFKINIVCVCFFLLAIRKAGKHMEDHIIAAHTALAIGYLLINDKYFNSNQRRFKIDTIRDRLKDRSFQFMGQIIRKFIVFMNIMVSFLFDFIFKFVGN